MKRTFGLILLLLGLSLGAKPLEAVAPVCAITGNMQALYGGPAAKIPVYFTSGSTQNAGGSIVPSNQRVMVMTDASGNLPTTGGCLPSPGTQFCPPQGSYFYMQVGNGPTTKELQAPLMTTVDVNQLVLENSDPVSVVTDIQSGNGNCSIVNPGTGQAGTATITCGGPGTGPAPGTPILILTAQCAAAGGTDQSAVIQAAFNAAAGQAIFVPACGTVGQGYNIATPIQYSLHTQGPIQIYCSGSGGPFFVNNATGGLRFVDATVYRKNGLTMRDCVITPVYSPSNVGYGLDLVQLALPKIENVSMDATGQPRSFTNAFMLEGTQQGRFQNDVSFHNVTGEYLTDNGGIGSNQNHFDHSYMGDNGVGTDIEGGAADNLWSAGSFQVNSDTGIINNQTTGTGGYGPNVCDACEFENNTVNHLYVKAGGFHLKSSLLTGSPVASDAVRIDPPSGGTPPTIGAWGYLEGNIFNAPVTILGVLAGQQDWLIGNIVNFAYTNSAGTSQVVTLGNTGAHAPDNNLTRITGVLGLTGGTVPSGISGGGLSPGSNTVTGLVGGAAATNGVTFPFSCPHLVVATVNDRTTAGGARVTTSAANSFTFSATVGDTVDYIAGCI